MRFRLIGPYLFPSAEPVRRRKSERERPAAPPAPGIHLHGDVLHGDDDCTVCL